MGWQDDLAHYIAFLSHRYGVTETEIEAQLLMQTVPASIFSTSLTPLQAACTHLAQTKTPEVIAGLLGRTPSDVKKHITTASLPTHGPTVPLSVLTDAHLPPAESIVQELETQGLSVSEIATLLDKHPQTIYTLRRRAQQRGDGQ